MNYYQKYQKYKNKYINYKKQYGGKKQIKKKSQVIDRYDFMFDDIDKLIHNPKDVKNEQDFIKFITFLWKEKVLDDKDIKSRKVNQYSSNYGWANNTVSTFLEQMLQGYSDHMNGGTYLNDTNIWTRVAKIIDLGKIYE